MAKLRNNSGKNLYSYQTDESSTISRLSLLKILKHFAAYTFKRQEQMTSDDYLLTLLKLCYIMVLCYIMLPNCGKDLMKIGGRDW